MKRKTLLFLLIALLLTGSGYFYYEHQRKQVRDAINGYLAVTFPYSTVTYNLQSVNPFSRTVVLTDMRIDNPEATLTVRQATFRNVTIKEGYKYPLTMELELNGIRLTGTSVYIPPPVRDLGLIPEEINFRGAYRIDPGRGTLDVSGITLNMADLGSLRVSIAMSAVPVEVFRDPYGFFEEFSEFVSSGHKPEEHPVYEKLMHMKFRSCSLVFRNDGLVQKLIRFVSTMEGKHPAAIISDVEREIDRGIVKAEIPEVKEVLLALKDFIRHPGTISLDISTSDPLSFLDIQNARSPEEIKRKLKITLKLNGKEHRII